LSTKDKVDHFVFNRQHEDAVLAIRSAARATT